MHERRSDGLGALRPPPRLAHRGFHARPRARMRTKRRNAAVQPSTQNRRLVVVCGKLDRSDDLVPMLDDEQRDARVVHDAGVAPYLLAARLARERFPAQPLAEKGGASDAISFC